MKKIESLCPDDGHVKCFAKYFCSLLLNFFTMFFSVYKATCTQSAYMCVFLLGICTAQANEQIMRRVQYPMSGN